MSSPPITIASDQNPIQWPGNPNVPITFIPTGIQPVQAASPTVFSVLLSDTKLSLNIIVGYQGTPQRLLDALLTTNVYYIAANKVTQKELADPSGYLNLCWSKGELVLWAPVSSIGASVQATTAAHLGEAGYWFATGTTSTEESNPVGPIPNPSLTGNDLPLPVTNQFASAVKILRPDTLTYNWQFTVSADASSSASFAGYQAWVYNLYNDGLYREGPFFGGVPGQKGIGGTFLLPYDASVVYYSTWIFFVARSFSGIYDNNIPGAPSWGFAHS